MSDKQEFKILYHLVEGEAEDICNRHLSECDHTLALKNVWRALDDTFGCHNRNPLTELSEQCTRPVTDYTIKGMCNLLSDMVCCRDHAGSKFTIAQSPRIY